MNESLNSLKGDQGILYRITIGVTKWDARSSDYGSYTPRRALRVCVVSSFRLRGTVSFGV